MRVDDVKEARENFVIVRARDSRRRLGAMPRPRIAVIYYSRGDGAVPCSSHAFKDGFEVNLELAVARP